jgi:hypothetical protein
LTLDIFNLRLQGARRDNHSFNEGATGCNTKEEAMAATTTKHDEVLKLFEETGKIIDSAWKEAGDAPNKAKKPKPNEKIPVKMERMPSTGMAGVDKNLLQLCATISGKIYDDEATNRVKFQKLLMDVPEVKDNFPDLQVRTYDKGVSIGKNLVKEQLSAAQTAYLRFYHYGRDINLGVARYQDRQGYDHRRNVWL